MVRSLALWAGLLFLFAAPSARAEFLAAPSVPAAPGWTFTWSPQQTISANSGSSSLRLLPSSGHGSGSSDIIAANLQAISSAPGNQPDPFTDKSYTLNLHLVDNASGQSGNLTFTGEIDGTLSSKSVALTNTFDQKTGTLHLGGHDYTVTLHSYTSPGLPGSAFLGALGGSISVDGAGTLVRDPPPPVHKTPEPSSFVLAVVGLFVLGTRRRYHRARAG
jgi:hypothetical protein